MALSGFLTEEDLRPLEVEYDRFMSREIPVPGKDFCDMSAEFDVPFDQWSGAEREGHCALQLCRIAVLTSVVSLRCYRNLINAMLPTKYHPELQNNIYERRAAHVCQQLFDVPMGLDYDQLLAKKPSKKAAVFAWHCDMAYWPPVPDTRTATFSLALDATTRANGCLRFVPGSHVSQTIRAHKPLHEDRTKAHAIACQVGKDEEVTYEEIPRGGVTIHNEYIVHGSGGNTTTGWRRTYVAAFRTKETIELERRAGFTHSHNDEVNWDTFNHWDK
jgi:phytanoyl-CoA hydroxylase